MRNAEWSKIEAETAARLERLACGELDESARGPLLAWLEEDPLRWRLCGLAFLEAQSWSETLAVYPAAVEAPVECRQADRQPPIASRVPPRRRLVPTLVAAASLLIAFALGLGTREVADWAGGSSTTRAIAGGSGERAARPHGGPVPQESLPGEAVLASLSVRPGSRLGPRATIQIPVVPSDSASASAADRDVKIPEYVREQWERRGYRLTTERRYLFAHLPNGREAVVPIEQVVVQPIPKQVY